MFARFARFISRYWILVLIAWVALPIGFRKSRPRWDDITHDGDFAYLPNRLPSVRGAELLERAFPDQASKSRLVLVIARDDKELTDEDKAVATRLAAEFTPKPNEKSLVTAVLTPDDRFIGSKLCSSDGKAELVVLQLDNEFMAIGNLPFIQSVYQRIHDRKKQPDFPAGLQLGAAGDAPVGSDMLWSMGESIKNTEVATIILVVAILLIVYRSPALVLVPLISIAASYFVSIDLIALVAKWCEVHHWDFQVFKTTQIFIVVVLFGAATDYCLFLIARYREELQRGFDPRAAIEEALGQTGHALTASAMTTILGLGAMIFADFGKYRSGGPTIAMSLVVALAACMTIAPSLLRAMGRAILWEIPASWIVFSVVVLAGNYAAIMHWGVPRRAAVIGAFAAANLAAIALFTVLWWLVVQAFRRDRASHPAAARGDAPQTLMARFWESLARVIVSHPGAILAGSFLLLAIPAYKGMDVPITYDMLAELNPNRESVQGMQLMEKHFSIGQTGPIAILAHSTAVNFDTPEQWANITTLAAELNSFVYTDSSHNAVKPISEVRSLTNPLGETLTKAKMELWTKRKVGLREFNRRSQVLAKSRPIYFASLDSDGDVVRFELICGYDPFSREAINLLGSIDNWLKTKKEEPGSPWKDVVFDYTGTTAQIRDLDIVNTGDTLWVGRYVALAVLIVLLFLIRRPLVSIYLIFTVVFGYLVSLGLTHVFFSWFYGSLYHGLDWKLKIFLFVILVAVGEDYNIYLVTRVFEEQRKRGPLDGLREAVARTGGIITSCGVIMAGTFGSMATGTLRSMIELGFAMSLGVLLDTFIIRTILVPAFLALLARWGLHSGVENRGDMAAPHYEAVGKNLMEASK